MRFGSWQVGPSGPGDEVVPAPFQLPSPTWLGLGLGSGSGLGLGLVVGFQLPSPTWLGSGSGLGLGSGLGFQLPSPTSSANPSGDATMYLVRVRIRVSVRLGSTRSSVHLNRVDATTIYPAALPCAWNASSEVLPLPPHPWNPTSRGHETRPL